MFASSDVISRLIGQSRIRKSKKKRNNFADLDVEEDADSKPAGIEDVRPDIDDEWPEEDVKPKKGKKGKKAKKQQVDEDDEDEEEVPEVKAAPVKVETPVEQEKPAEKEVDEKDDDDEGPKVGSPLSVCDDTDQVAINEEGEGEAEEGEREGVSIMVVVATRLTF